ncbi:undecaprenyldiphospho-muramoylpentapeptide beta-N-acetylglucosaminyltransferase [Candidatus Spongiihabitans sp.]|uniref:undecaprenyldiphospho-muramoylpentapeptide beta-N-acetylglucosaminyltransferase n=1 Tax=Candidatus Spongiihabitans sp. TaxID=3101308 RepID=UPI003C79E10E
MISAQSKTAAKIKTETSRMMIMAGGTGGHVMPALAVAKELMRQGVEVSWIGTRQGLEARLVTEANITFNAIDIKGLRNSGVARKILMPFMLARAIAQTLRVILKRKPKAILAMGGFVSGPGGLAAAALRLPIVLHEQNSVAGLTNRWLSRFSHRILTGFPSADGFRQFQWIGNPVRPEISNIPDPKIRLASRKQPLRLLIVGGSQGAEVFNRQLPKLFATNPIPDVDIWHQSGTGGRNGIGAAYLQAGLGCQVNEFIDDMPAAYAWCDIVICRSGAMTVSEVCCAGAVAIFVPYPHAVNDHQAKNAAYLVGNNAAYMVLEEQFVQGHWLKILTRFDRDRKLLVAMASAARKLAKPHATQDLARVCMEAMRMEAMHA